MCIFLFFFLLFLPFSFQKVLKKLISFSLGDLIEVFVKNPNGWWKGEKDGKRGVFPGSFVRVVEEAKENGEEEGEGGVGKEEMEKFHNEMMKKMEREKSQEMRPRNHTTSLNPSPNNTSTTTPTSKKKKERKKVFSVRNFTEKDYKEAGFHPPDNLSSQSSPPVLPNEGGAGEKKSKRKSKRVTSVKNFGTFGRKKHSHSPQGGGKGGEEGGGAFFAAVPGGGGREDEVGVGLADEGEEKMRVKGRKRRAGVGGEGEWPFTDGQLEVLVRHFLGESVGISSSHTSKLRGLLTSEGEGGSGGKGRKKVGKKVIQEWFGAQRGRFGLLEKPASVKSFADISLFECLVDQQVKKNCEFLQSQMHVFVRHFVTKSMDPTREEVEGLLEEVGERGNGGVVVTPEVVEIWFRDMRREMEKEVRGVKEWVAGGGGVGLYAVVVGFESQFLAALLESDLDPNNFGF